MKWIDTVEKILNAVGLTGASVAVGLISSTIAQIRGKKKPLWEYVVSGLSGGFGAAFLGPVVAHFLNADNETVKYGIVFFVGLFAKDLADFVVAIIQFASKNPGTIIETLKNRFKTPGR